MTAVTSPELFPGSEPTANLLDSTQAHAQSPALQGSGSASPKPTPAKQSGPAKQPGPAKQLGPARQASPNNQIRLRKHADYQRAYKASRKQFSSSMTWFLAARPDAPQAIPRVGLTVGKVIGKAHERNRIKRRLRELVRSHIHELPRGVDLILHPRRFVIEMDFLKLDAELLRIFRQAASQSRQAASRQPAPAVPTRPPQV